MKRNKEKPPLGSVGTNGFFFSNPVLLHFKYFLKKKKIFLQKKIHFRHWDWKDVEFSGRKIMTSLALAGTLCFGVVFSRTKKKSSHLMQCCHACQGLEFKKKKKKKLV